MLNKRAVIDAAYPLARKFLFALDSQWPKHNLDSIQLDTIIHAIWTRVENQQNTPKRPNISPEFAWAGMVDK